MRERKPIFFEMCKHVFLTLHASSKIALIVIYYVFYQSKLSSQLFLYLLSIKGCSSITQASLAKIGFSFTKM